MTTAPRSRHALVRPTRPQTATLSEGIILARVKDMRRRLLNLRLDESKIEQLNRIAQARGGTVSDVIREILDEALERPEPQDRRLDPQTIERFLEALFFCELALIRFLSPKNGVIEAVRAKARQRTQSFLDGHDADAEGDVVVSSKAELAEIRAAQREGASVSGKTKPQTAVSPKAASAPRVTARATPKQATRAQAHARNDANASWWDRLKAG